MREASIFSTRTLTSHNELQGTNIGILPVNRGRRPSRSTQFPTAVRIRSGCLRAVRTPRRTGSGPTRHFPGHSQIEILVPFSSETLVRKPQVSFGVGPLFVVRASAGTSRWPMLVLSDSDQGRNQFNAKIEL